MSSPTSRNAAMSPDSSPSNDSSTPSSISSPLSHPPPSSNSSSSSPSISPPDESPPLNESPSSKGSPPPASQKKTPLTQILSPPELSSSDGKGKTPLSPSYSDSGGPSSNSHSSSVSLPAIAGIVGGILVLIIILIILSCVGKKKKKNFDNVMQYYADPSTRKGGNYFVGGQPPKWGNQGHEVPLPPGGGWNVSPVPMANDDDISSVFAGPHVPSRPPPSPISALGFNKNTFTYEELAAATKGFIQANLLGQGGFGYVHKGVLPNGKEIAVKSLKLGSGQGEREFHAEVDIISRVHHRHLLSLVGYCIAGSKRMLVYDFVPNKTLEYHLHGKGLPTMDWPTRLKIALGSAKGLAYLHEDCHPRIIHRDIKTANILLDFKFEALVADFGLAKLSLDNNTHVSTRVMGTFGYLAPEYASSGKLTEKSDVFSYGVMLLELITGQRPNDSSPTFMDDCLVDWARPVLSEALTDGNYDELVDPKLEGNYDPMEMARMVACAAAAVRHSAKRRPKMSQIVRALDGNVSLEDLNEGMRPGQSMLFSSGSYYDSDHSSTRKNVRKAPVASSDYSDEFSEPIDEYGLYHVGSSSSEGLFSDEFNPIGNQRLRGHPQL